MNVAISFYNISRNLDFRSDDNCVSPLGQTIKADSHIACRAYAVPPPGRAVNSHMPCRAPAMLRQCRVLRESPRGSRKYPNC